MKRKFTINGKEVHGVPTTQPITKETLTPVADKPLRRSMPSSPEDVSTITKTRKDTDDVIELFKQAGYEDDLVSALMDNGADQRIRDVIVSTNTPDRDGDIMLVEGCDYSNWEKNPVILWSHDHHTPAIGRGLDIWTERRGNTDCLCKTVYFCGEAEGHMLADTLYKLVSNNIIKAFSVGFGIGEYVWVEDEQERQQVGLGRNGVIFSKWELWESSLCNVPANPEALAKAVNDGVVNVMDFTVYKAMLCNRIIHKAKTISDSIVIPEGEIVDALTKAIKQTEIKQEPESTDEIKAVIEGINTLNASIDEIKAILDSKDVAAKSNVTDVNVEDFSKAITDYRKKCEELAAKVLD